MVAWCEDCDGVICQPCLSLHEQLTAFKEHVVHHIKKVKKCDEEESSPVAESVRRASVKCMRHACQKLKYLCNECSELVCSECIIEAHKNHNYSSAKEARPVLETKMKELAGLVTEKKQEFSEYLKKANEAEGKALEYSELMKSEVNNVFDGIVASVEAQRNEALQSVSQEVKEIWSQKEMMEVSLAQLGSFTKFADHTHKCVTDTSYIAMAAQGVKLMQRLKDIHGDEYILNQKKLVLGSKPLPLEKVFALGQPSLEFSPKSGSSISVESGKSGEVTITVTLMVDKLPSNSPSIHEKCKLEVSEVEETGTGYNILGYGGCSSNYKLAVQRVIPVQEPISWQVIIQIGSSVSKLQVTCQSLGDITTSRKTATYKVERFGVFTVMPVTTVVSPRTRW